MGNGLQTGARRGRLASLADRLWSGSGRNTAGLCLAELMIALAAGAVVLGATLHSVQHLDRHFRMQQDTIALNQDVRLGLEVVGSELRRAGNGGSTTAGVVVAEPSLIEFDTNLEGVHTALTEPVTPDMIDLPVADGGGWPNQRRVVVCGQDGCAQGRLARDGRRRTLSLEAPLDRPFPAGSRVLLINRVRYYLGRDQHGGQSLMRWADGGANPLIGAVEDWHLRYLDREGRPASHPDRVARLRVELTPRGAQVPILREFALSSP